MSKFTTKIPGGFQDRMVLQFSPCYRALGLSLYPKNKQDADLIRIDQATVEIFIKTAPHTIELTSMVNNTL